VGESVSLSGRKGNSIAEEQKDGDYEVRRKERKRKREERGWKTRVEATGWEWAVTMACA
jgi:hypothetical protein